MPASKYFFIAEDTKIKSSAWTLLFLNISLVSLILCQLRLHFVYPSKNTTFEIV